MDPSEDGVDGFDISRQDPGAPFVLDFDPESLVMAPDGPIGRRSAGAGLLQAVCDRFGRSRLPVSFASKQGETAFFEATKTFNVDHEALWTIYRGDLQALADVGALLVPGPHFVPDLWGRRFLRDDAFSIVGQTHSLSTTAVVDHVNQMFIAPSQPWDALICTSQAGHTAVINIMECHCEYLASRGIEALPPPIRLPVIPLGVHCGRFAHGKSTESQRTQMRRRHDIGEEDVVVLGFGRIDPFTKAHPAPLLLAVEKARKRLEDDVRLHLMLVGRAPRAEILEDLRHAAQKLSPSIRLHCIDGAAPEADESWFAADIFISLSDNVQETFGLVPVEAMAASLPCIVSDWSGYRETVENGVTGIHVPTYGLGADSGLGVSCADAYGSDRDPYQAYAGKLAQTVAVDIAAAAEGIAALAKNKEFRLEMGRQARRRAQSRYAWPVIVEKYVELTAELAEIRARGGGLGMNHAPANARTVDPLRVFAHYPTSAVAPSWTVAVGDGNWRDTLVTLAASPMSNFVARMLLPSGEIYKLVEAVEKQSATLGELRRRYAQDQGCRFDATCQWLLKYAILVLASGQAA